jgi:ankyrin repeat protein/WD40 repeat protein/uncharacterized caspase-like protein
MKTRLPIAALCVCLSGLPAGAQQTPELIVQQPRSNQNAEILAFSSDGNWLATTCDQKTLIWDVGSKLQVKSIPKASTGLPDSLLSWVTESNEEYQAITFVPNSDLIAGLRHSFGTFQKHNSKYRIKDHFIKYSFTVWNWKKGEMTLNIPLQFKKDYAQHHPYLDKHVDDCQIACTPDGSAVILGVNCDDRQILLAWSVASGKLLLEKTLDQTLYPESIKMGRLQAHADNKSILIGWQNEREPNKDRIEIWNLYTGQLESALAQGPGRLLDFGIDAENKYLFGVYPDNTQLKIARWDWATRKLAPLKGQDKYYKVIAGKFDEAAGFLFRAASLLYIPYKGIFDLSKPGDAPAYPEPGNFEARAGVPVPGPGIVFFKDLLFYDWGAQTKDYLPNYERHGYQTIDYVHFGKDGVIGWRETGNDRKTKVWELSRLNGRRAFYGNKYGLTNTGVYESEDGKKAMQFYNLKTGKKTETAVLDEGATFSADHKWAVSNKTVYLWDEKSQDYKPQKSFENNNDLYYFDPAGTYLYSVAGGTEQDCRTCKVITQWQLPQVKKVKQFVAPDDVDWDAMAVISLEASADGAWLLALRPGYIAQVFSTATGKLAYRPPFAVNCAAFTPDGKQLLLANLNKVSICHTADFMVKSAFFVGESAIRCFDFNPEGTRLLFVKAEKNASFHFLNWPQKQTIAEAYLYDSGHSHNASREYLIHTPAQYFCNSKNFDSYFGFQYGGQFYRFEHFDLLKNRPDLVLKTLGYAEPAYLGLLEKTCQKRWEKHKINKAAAEAGTAVPKVVLTNKNTLPGRTTERKLRLQVEASDPAYPLSRLQVMVNEVPIFGPQGKDISPAQSRKYTGSLELDLVSLKNLVEVQVWNNQGIASLRAGHRVQFDGEIPKPDLYIVTIGVSRYRDSTMNLQYAAKDASDVNNLFKSRFGAFRRIIPIQYLDEAVTKEKMQELKAQLSQSRPEDRVIVFAAGHGLLDEKFDFYYASHDIDFSNPARRGISFETLESLVSDIPARQKILLLDACHSGELDATTVRRETKPVEAGSGEKVVFRSVSGKLKKKDGNASPFDLMKDLFTDLRRQSGAIIISAASGEEVAMEGGGITNGLFTYALLKGLSPGLPADKDENEAVTAAELQQYILETVPQLTEGAQQPTSRVEYLYNDFEIWQVKGAGKNPISLGDYEKKTPEEIKNAVLRGADINGKDDDGATLLMLAAYEYDDPELLRWLVSKGADPRQKGTIYEYEKGEKTGTYYGNLIGIAVAQNKPALLKFFIETCKIPVDDREFNEKTRTDSGWTGLQWAANRGNTELAKYLLDHGAKPDGVAGADDSTPLMLAAGKGHLEVAKLLVQRGAVWQTKSIAGHSLMHLAARNGHLEILRWLVSLGANVNDQDNMGWTPAMFAGIKKQFYCFDYLLSQKADMTIASKKRLTIRSMANPNKVFAIPEIIDYQGSERGMFVAIKSRDSLEIARRIPLLKDLNAPDANGGTLLMHLAKETDFLPLIQLLINRGADLRPHGFVWTDSVNGGFYGNLQGIAAGKGNLDMLKYFIETCRLEVDGKEFDQTSKAFTGWTALQWACTNLNGTWEYNSGWDKPYFEPDPTILDYLLAKGADINIGKNEGGAPLLMALAKAPLPESLVRDWIEVKKADIRVTDNWGRNALHYFAMYGIFTKKDDYYKEERDKYYRLLDVNKQDNDGYTPLMLAAFNRSGAVEYLLKQPNLKLNQTNKEGNTALMLSILSAIQKSEQEEDNWRPYDALDLLKAGADCGIKNKQQQKALDLAEEIGSQELIEQLEKKAGCR